MSLLPRLNEIRLAVLGLGYVGLPLAVEFGKSRSVLGFDINEARILALKGGHDATLEVPDEELQEATHLSFTSDLESLSKANVFIVTVPTPIDEHKRPDLTPLIKVEDLIGKPLSPSAVTRYVNELYANLFARSYGLESIGTTIL